MNFGAMLQGIPEICLLQHYTLTVFPDSLKLTKDLPSGCNGAFRPLNAACQEIKRCPSIVTGHAGYKSL